jgi:hypothetical protein
MGLKEKAIESIKADGLNLEKLSDKWKQDFDVVLAACTNNGFAIKYASLELKSNKDIANVVLKKQPLLLSEFGYDIKNDNACVEIATKVNGLAFQHASIELKKDKEFVIKISEISPLAFAYCDESLKDDPDLIKRFLPKSPGLYGYLNSNLKENKDLALLCIEQNGLSVFQYLSDNLRIDKNLILEAIDLVTSTYFKKASESVMKLLPDKYFGVIPYIHEDLQKDISFIKVILEKDKRFIHRAKDDLKNNPEIINVLK